MFIRAEVLYYTTLMIYNNSHLAAIYDADNPDGEDHDFFRAKAEELTALRIVDLGCGTGLLTTTLVSPDRSVVGIDPADAMLDVARARPDGQQVEWLQGTAELIQPASVDLAIMSGNVAMHILSDEWHKTLGHISKGLLKGGNLIFESRNPDAEAWKNWSHQVTRETPIGLLQESEETTEPDEHGIVTMKCHYRFLEDNYELDTQQKLQFRSHQQIVEDLEAVGLVVTASYKNWHREDFTGGLEQPLMVFAAEKE